MLGLARRCYGMLWHYVKARPGQVAVTIAWQFVRQLHTRTPASPACMLTGSITWSRHSDYNLSEYVTTRQRMRYYRSAKDAAAVWIGLRCVGGAGQLVGGRHARCVLKEGLPLMPAGCVCARGGLPDASRRVCIKGTES